MPVTSARVSGERQGRVLRWDVTYKMSASEVEEGSKYMSGAGLRQAGRALREDRKTWTSLRKKYWAWRVGERKCCTSRRPGQLDGNTEKGMSTYRAHWQRPPCTSLEPMSTASQSIRPLSLPNDQSPSTASHRPYNGPNIVQGLKEQEVLRTQGRNATTISMLTDNVLVEIFDFCRKDHDQCPSSPVWKWHILVHVCRRWRQITFASPRRLNLQILCIDGTPVRKNLGIWPDYSYCDAI
ncbi:hypothetical protein EDB87DRAFT_1260555 [Lactarius vividus]|nr:hypothetical protein EDB87DRAFT_1260555 [Lactarius vividus]